MSSHHKIEKDGFIWGAVFLTLVLLMPAPVGSEDNGCLLKKGSTWDSQAPELEPVTEYGAFFGLKITLKLEGGWNTFSGGDIRRGIMGMYDNGIAAIYASGVPVIADERESGRGGLEVGGDLIYAITQRFGIGIGMAGISAWKESHLVFEYPYWGHGMLQIRPHVKVSTLRAGLFYSLPFAGFLAVSVRGGPAFYSTEYTYVLGCESGFLRDGLIYTSYSQEASAKQLGFEGGLGLEFNPNPFVAIFVEVQGRYAKIRNLEGEETATFFQGGQYRQSASSGPVYIVEIAANPELDIVPSGDAVPGNAGKATLDFSGVSILAGLKFRL